jgi:branched-chain amino acid transport system permease protein
MSVSVPVVGDVGRRAVGVLGLLVVLLVAPLVLSEFLTGVIIMTMILGLFAMGFNVLFGYTGLLSFGHAAFYGAGAYIVAIFLSHSAVPETVQSLIPAILLGIVGTVAIAAVIGILCVQRGEIYFSMLTLAFSMMLYRGVIQFDSITGGVNGLIISGTQINLGFASFDALNTGVYYYFTFFVVVGAIALLWRIIHSPYGELLKAVRENPERAEFIGLPVKYYQWSSFILSGTVAGLAGALAASRIFVVTPGTVHWLKSAEPVIVTLIGGPSSFLGPIVGATIFIGLEQVLTGVTSNWQAALGIVLIPLVIYAQNGVVGLVIGENSIPNKVRELMGRTGGPESGEEVNQ